MKQTKKLTRNQREFLRKQKLNGKPIDTYSYRLVEELPDSITVQHVDGDIVKFYK